VKKAGGSLVTNSRLFDVYEGDNLPEGKKSLAISVTLQAEDKTLSEDDINHTASSIVQSAAKRLGAELRA
jgi:phenylalanyl-tRNA synthetase beta chain